MDVLLAAIDPVILLGNIVILPVIKSLVQTRVRSSSAMPVVRIWLEIPSIRVSQPAVYAWLD